MRPQRLVCLIVCVCNLVRGAPACCNARRKTATVNAFVRVCAQNIEKSYRHRLHGQLRSTLTHTPSYIYLCTIFINISNRIWSAGEKPYTVDAFCVPERRVVKRTSSTHTREIVCEEDGCVRPYLYFVRSSCRLYTHGLRVEPKSDTRASSTRTPILILHTRSNPRIHECLLGPTRSHTHPTRAPHPHKRWRVPH